MRLSPFPPLLATLLFFLALQPAGGQTPDPAAKPPAEGTAESTSSPGVTSEDLLEPGDLGAPHAAATGSDAQPDPLADQESSAEQAFADGEMARAIEIYRSLGATHPVLAERSRLRVTAAWLLFQQGNVDGATQELTGALFNDPGYLPRTEIYSPDFVALFQNAQRDAKQKRDAAATKRLREGVAALAAGDPVAARKAITESLELAPGSARALFALAQVELREQKIDAALAGFEHVLSLGRGGQQRLPTDLQLQTLNNVGVIYFGRDQFEDAASSLEEATRLSDRDARVWFNLGLARQKLHLDAPALDALRRAHELDRRDPEIALQLGRAYIAATRWMEAVAVLLEGTEAHPESPLLWLEFASAQRGLGNPEGTSTSLGKAMDLDPANAQGAGLRAAMELAQAALNAKNFGQATAAAAAATRMAPADGSAWALLGLAQRASGKLDDAATALEKAASVAPDRADIAHNLGTIYLAQHRYPEAEAAFRRAVTLDPSATESVAALARLQARGSASGSTSGKGNAGKSSAVKPDLGARLSAVDYPPLGIRGLLVEAVTAGGLGDRSGLLVNDLVLQADGRALTQVATLTALLSAAKQPVIDLAVLRAGKPVQLTLRVR
ncbi:MAG: tetratricopeptide repeat protein [Thermoanaerobaculia bacterium]